MKSVADVLRSVSEETLKRFLADLSPNALLAIPWLFELWALPRHQLPPEGDWQNWVILGGRGAGKTRAGAEWVRTQVEGAGPTDPGKCRKVALIGETLDQAREVMVMGESGIINCSPPDRRPKWHATRKALIWPNGAEAYVFSASDPEALRGPQFDCAWLDELAKWKKGRETWDMLQFALRLGDFPQQVITTTPRPNPLLKDILALPETAQTSAPSSENALNLADGFIDKITTQYAGTWLARQEIDGEMIEERAGALWSRDQLESCRSDPPDRFDRIILAVDPPVTSTENSDACGIIVAGVVTNGPPNTWQAYILDDASIQGATPMKWAAHVVQTAQLYGVDRVIAEVNQGGDLVETLIRQIDPLLAYSPVRASRGKSIRAEPVAALYEQGRVYHARGFAALEDEMCAMTLTGFTGRKSPDRLDALVWALNELLLKPAATWQQPRVREI